MITPWVIPCSDLSSTSVAAQPAASPSGTIANSIDVNTRMAMARSTGVEKTMWKPSPVSRSRWLRCAAVIAGSRYVAGGECLRHDRGEHGRERQDGDGPRHRGGEGDVEALARLTQQMAAVRGGHRRQPVSQADPDQHRGGGERDRIDHESQP